MELPARLGPRGPSDRALWEVGQQLWDPVLDRAAGGDDEAADGDEDGEGSIKASRDPLDIVQFSDFHGRAADQSLAAGAHYLLINGLSSLVRRAVVDPSARFEPLSKLLGRVAPGSEPSIALAEALCRAGLDQKRVAAWVAAHEDGAAAGAVDRLLSDTAHVDHVVPVEDLECCEK